MMFDRSPGMFQGKSPITYSILAPLRSDAGGIGELDWTWTRSGGDSKREREPHLAVDTEGAQSRCQD
jgi:hypothetical protein